MNGFVFEEDFGEAFVGFFVVAEGFFDAGELVGGDVAPDAADLNHGVMDTVAGEVLEEVHDVFTDAEGVVEGGVEAEFVGFDACPEEVGVDALDFADDGADVVGAIGDGELGDLLNGAAVGDGVGDAAESANAFGEIDDLDGAAHAHPLDAAVGHAGGEVGLDDFFALDLKGEHDRLFEGGVGRADLCGVAGGLVDENRFHRLGFFIHRSRGAVRLCFVVARVAQLALGARVVLPARAGAGVAVVAPGRGRCRVRWPRVL